MRNNVQRIFSLLMSLVLIISVGLFPVQAKNTGIYNTRDDFYWGINHHGAWVASYPGEYLEERIHLIAKSGATMVRINGGLNSDMTLIDQEVGLCNKYGLKIIMTFIPSFDLGPEFIEMSFKSLAERYNGKNGRGFVDYIQAWNETDSDLIKAKLGPTGGNGSTYDAYYTISVDGYPDLPEYTEYFRAAAKGVHEADSDTKFMINFCYKGWGSIRWYLEHGIDIDVIGWDSYGQHKDANVSTAAFRQDCDDLYNDVVKKYDIPVIICEANTIRDLIPDYNATRKLENYQILLNMMDVAYSYNWIKGFVVYELLDEPNRGSDEAHWGIVDCALDGIIGEPKPIYNEIQRRWGGNENLPMIDRSKVDLKPYEKLKVDTTDDSYIGKDDNKNNTSDIVIPDIDFDFSDDNIGAQGAVIVEPETIVKQTNSVKTIWEVPWLLLILCGAGLLLLSGGGVVTYVILSKKKTKKNSLQE